MKTVQLLKSCFLHLSILCIYICIFLVCFTKYENRSKFSLVQVNKNIETYNSSDSSKLNSDKVDFRVIVITFNRSKSLEKLLQSLNTVELDGDSGGLDIWIDRDTNNVTDTETLDIASNFNWTGGKTRVHVHDRHVGLYGQWIDTWTPDDSSKNSSEIAVILEDDIILSPFIYRWLKAVHRHYGNKPEFFGATLVSDEPSGKESKFPPMKHHKNHTVYYHKYPDTWGLSPSPYHWNLFQKWCHRTYKTRSDFQPYVPGTVFTNWYKTFQRMGTEQNMWSMWIVYYTYSEQLFTLYNNLVLYSGIYASCLAVNSREVGLHYPKGDQRKNETCELMVEWKDEYVKFPKKTLMTHYNGSIIDRYNLE